MCVAVLSLGGCAAGGATSAPFGDGVRVEPELHGRFEVVRGMFSPGVDAPPGVVPMYLFHSVALGDCDGDGRLDVFDLNDGRLRVQQQDGQFVDGDELMRYGAGAATFADLALGEGGADGIEDLVLADNGGVNVLPGLGGCHFGEPLQVAGVVSGFPGQVLVRDVDGDGLADLSVTRVTSPDAPYRLLLAVGDGRFEDATPPPTPSNGPDPNGYQPFTTYFDDVDDDGTLDQFVIIDRGRSWFSWGVPGDRPTFTRDESISTRIAVPSAMGLSPLDFDRDGRTDYFLPIAASSGLLWNRGGRELRDEGPRSQIVGPQGQDEWGTMAFDADLDGWTDLLMVRVSDNDHSAGPVALYMNRHDGTFADVAPSVIGEVSLRAQALVCGDLASDGKVSCFTREPTGHVLLRNELEPKGRWLGVRLRGTVSSAEAAGARVALEGEARPLVVVADGQSPSWGEHRREVLLALGERTSGTVSVTWPSGLKQTVSDLPAGAYATIEEPRVLTVSRRLAPADGEAVVEVRAAPGLVGATKVAIEREGAGSWQGAATQEADGTWVRRLVAPAEAGEARIVLSLDGEALRVRPRVRFGAQ